MFKGRSISIRDSCYNKPIKNSIAKEFSIEFVARFIQVFLQVFLSYSMIHVHEKAFRIGNGRMYPRENLGCILWLNNFFLHIGSDLVRFRM